MSCKNIDAYVAPMFRKIYDIINQQYAKPSSLPQIVVTLADYQYKSAFVADQEVNFITYRVDDTECHKTNPFDYINAINVSKKKSYVVIMIQSQKRI